MSGTAVANACVAAILFLGAFTVRVSYQQLSVVKNPIRADARLYVFAAYNLRNFGVYSVERPRKDRAAPTVGSDQPPGYPVYLSAFLTTPFAVDASFERRVSRSQAVLGALTCTFTFLLARLALPLPFAALAGALVACNPHLIASDQYLLTESLFTVLLVLGALLLTWSWRRGSGLGIAVAAVLVATSAHVRLVSLFLVPFLAPILLLEARNGSLVERRVWARRMIYFGFGWLIVFGVQRAFVRFTAPPGPAAPVIERRYGEVASPTTYLARAVRPPRFYVNGESHVHRFHRDRSYKDRTERSFGDVPMSYLGWNLVGRWKVMWHWENSYNGDVDIYPMLRRGFEESSVLGLIHRSMRALHWPLFVLSLAAPIVFVVRWRRRSCVAADWSLLVPILGFVYFLSVLSILSFWLPRYTLPVRPFSYILAMAVLSWATAWAWPRRQGVSRRRHARAKTGSQRAVRKGKSRRGRS